MSQKMIDLLKSYSLLPAVFLSILLRNPIVADFVDEPTLPVKPQIQKEVEQPAESKRNSISEDRPSVIQTQPGTASPFPSAKTTASGSSQTSKETKPTKSSADSEFQSKAKIETEADLLEGSYAKGRVKLAGNVKITQADTVLKSETAEIFAKENASVPYRAVAKGKVTIVKSASAASPLIRASADELEYFFDTRRVVLKGRPKILRGKEQLQGELVEIFLDSGEVKIRGAQGILDPKSKDLGTKKGK
jgi:lipopolysaccharide transport protein LptA